MQRPRMIHIVASSLGKLPSTDSTLFSLLRDSKLWYRSLLIQGPLIFSIDSIFVHNSRIFHTVHSRTTTSGMDPWSKTSTMKYRKTPPMWFTRSLLSLCHGYTNPKEYTRGIQENTWLKTKPRTSYLCLAYSIFSRDAMEALLDAWGSCLWET